MSNIRSKLLLVQHGCLDENVAIIHDIVIKVLTHSQNTQLHVAQHKQKT